MDPQTPVHEPWCRLHPLHFLHYTLLLIISCNMLAAAGAVHPSNETDRQALLAFKDQISADPHKVLSSWNTSLHFCSWQGVSCGSRHFRVTALNLSTLDLEGHISPHLANLSFLRFIVLPNNSFNGKIPKEMGRLFRLQVLDLGFNSLDGAIPASLSNCSQLMHIDLTSNRLAGEVSSDLGLVSKLIVLFLGGNNLTGVYPPFLANLSSLARLILTSNSFHGAIPEDVGILSGLDTLYLGDNNFFGNLPPTIYNLSSLERLSLHDNQMSGSISPHIGYFFPKLLNLNVRVNQFTGTIPHSLCNASHLQRLQFSFNRFHGSIPICLGKLQDLSWVGFSYNRLGTKKGHDLHFITSLTNCTRLERLYVESAQLKGPLPASIANITNALLSFSLGTNQIYGKIPRGIENILSLGTLGLFDNHLTGPIPRGLGKLTNLGGLYLYGNSFSGQIPASLGNLTRLVHLLVWENQLQGSIPPSLGNCSFLETLHLFDNTLNGNIPNQVFNLKSMVSLSLSSNLLDGNLPLEVGQLLNLNSLDLSNNKLSGEIPNALGKCRSLIKLHLSHNFFVGTIPKLLSALSAAEEIDFSSNNLSGMIPPYFTEFTFLQLLNFSFNDLDGEVPDQGPFKNASIVSVLGNNKLCGGILELHLPSCQKHGRRSHGRSFLLKVMLPLTVGTCIFIFSCGLYVYYWRKKPRNEQTTSLHINEQHIKVTYAELHQATNSFSSANLVGSGSFGSVFRGTTQSYQMDIAVKVIKIEDTSLQSFTAECEALKKIRHRNIVKILTSCSSLDFQGNDFKAIVFKFMPNGNLESWLHPHVDQDLYLSLSKRLDVAIDITQALDYLHNQCETPIVHCDLKPNNILLDEDMVAHVSDFGLARFLLTATDDTSNTALLKGSIGYIPPEYSTGHKVTTQGDVYSYGILLLEMFMGKRPTHEMFNDGLTVSKHAQMTFQDKWMEIVDPRLLLKENIEDYVKFKDCLSSVIKIGVTCTAEFPQNRTNIKDVCTKLQVVREQYCKGILRQTK